MKVCGWLLLAALVLSLGLAPRADEIATACDGDETARSIATEPFLRLVTLNIAHGRKDAKNQMFLSAEDIRANLEEAAGLLKAIDAQVVALQEADAPSSWRKPVRRSIFNVFLTPGRQQYRTTCRSCGNKFAL